jgi:DNA-binding CsgD family transcriptional regulator
VTRQLFEPVLVRAEPGERRVLLTAAAAGAEAVLLSDAPAQSGSAPELLRVLHGLYWLCANLAERATLLLAVDDVHWSDSESLRWLSYMVNRVCDLPVLLVVAARPGEEPTDAAALAAIASAPDVELLRLAPLNEHSSARLVRAIRGQQTVDDFCRACHVAAGGNPLYVRELCLESEYQEIAPVAIAAQRVARLGPQAIARAMRLRIAHLPESCATVARAAAVLGLDVELRDAAALAAIDMETAERAADALAAAGVLRLARPLNFKHPVIGAAIYADLPPGARSLAHAQAAALLADREADPGRVGAHLLLVEPAGDTLVLKRLRDAATDSLRRGAPATAVTYLRRALTETNDGRARVELLFELGRAALTAGEHDAVDHLMQVIASDPDVDTLVEAVLLAGSALQLANRAGDAHDLVRQAIDRLDVTSLAQHGLRLEGLRMQAAGVDPEFTDEVKAHLPALLARADRAGHPERSILIVGALRAAASDDSAHQVRALVERGLQHGRAMSQDIADSPVTGWAVIALVFIDDLEEADELVGALFADARARGSVHAYAGALLWRGWIALRRGLIPAAESDERAAAEFAAQHGLPLHLPWASAFRASALIELGQLDAAEDLADLAVAQPPHAPTAGMALDARGRLRIAQGRYGEGIADLRSAGEFHESIGAYSPNILHWRSSLAIALGRESPEALALVDVELERARSLGYARAIGVALRARGLLQAADEGLATLREAATVLDGSPARLEYARTLVQFGAALRRHGQRSAGRDTLREALDLADRLGAERLAAQARAELVAAGGRPRRRHVSGFDSLTPTERRIAEMAATGSGNKDIAQALFVSVKTVEMHLSHTYRKLTIRSRHELQAAMGSPDGARL